jgi:hypothetical protein
MSTPPSKSRGRKQSDTSTPADGVSELFRDLKLAIEYRPYGQKIETVEKRGIVSAGVALPGGLGYVFLGWPHRGSAGMEDE